MVLTEGGPRLLGQLVADEVLDELFLTVSPVLAGRGETARPGLVSAQEILPARAEPTDLISVRRRASYLFLRYRLLRDESRGLGSGSDGRPGSRVQDVLDGCDDDLGGPVDRLGDGT